MILRLSEYIFRIEYQRGQDNIKADVLFRLPFASAENVEKPNALNDAPLGAKPFESQAPRSNSLNKPSTTLFIPDLTEDFLICDEDLSETEDTDSDCDLELSNGETDSNFN